MKILHYEWKKLSRQRSLWLLLSICTILNLVFLNISEQNNAYYSPGEYRAMWEGLFGMDAQEAYEQLTAKNNKLQKMSSEPDMENTQRNEGIFLYTGDVWTERQLVEKITSELSYSLGYQEYLTQIKKDAENMLQVSIFQTEGDFSNRNIQKTVNDFASMEGLVPGAGIVRGVTMATGFFPTDFIGIVMLFAICIFLILQEKQTGQIALLLPTSRGRQHLAGAKLLILAAFTFLTVLLLYLGNFTSAYVTYGFGDLQRLVQSVPEYQSSILALPIWEYFLLFFACKYMIYYLFGLIIFAICLCMPKWLHITATVFAILGVSLAAYHIIPENSIAAPLKYINLFYFLRTDTLMMHYKNVNLFGYPVGILSLFPVALCVAVSAMLALILVTSRGSHILWNGKGLIAGRKHLVFIKHSLYIFEFMKIHKKNAVLFVLLAFIGIQSYRIQEFSYFEKPDDLYFRSYMNYLSGPIDENTIRYVNEECARYETLQSQAVTDENQQELYDAMLPFNAWEKTLGEYERISAANEDGKELSMVYPDGFLQLMGGNPGGDMASAFLLGLALSVCLSGIFSGDFEGRMDLLIDTTAGGRRDTLNAKRRLSLLLAASIFIIINALDFLMYYMEIGMQGFSVPLQSINIFSECRFHITIWQYLLLLYMSKFLGMIVIVHVIWLLSYLAKDAMRAMLLSTAFFSIPGLAGILGFDGIAKVVILPFVSGNSLLNAVFADGNFIYPFILAVVGAGIVISVNWYLRKKYQE